MVSVQYHTVTGRSIPIDSLSSREQEFLRAIASRYSGTPPWSEFGAEWSNAFQKERLDRHSPIYRICQDLEARLGIAQGQVAPPDYRDYLQDLIEERFGSRNRFCTATGMDPGQLSRVLR